MVKQLRFFCMALMLSLGMSSMAQTTQKLGYCADEIGADAYEYVLDNSYRVCAQAAVVIPASRMQTFEGAEILALRIGAVEGVKKMYGYIKHELEGVSEISPVRIESTVQGWNEVALKKPFKITGQQIVLGYSCEIPGGKGLLMNGKTSANGTWLNAGNGWQSAESLNKGSFCIQAVMQLNGEVSVVDLAVEGCSLEKPFYRVGEEVSAVVSVANYGASAVSTPKMYYQLNDNEPKLIETSGEISPNEAKFFSVKFLTDQCNNGLNPLKIWAETTDSYKKNDTLSVSVPCYTESYPHKTLVEHFTTLPCGFCPRGIAMLNVLLKDRKDCVWMSHHAGYSSDELTKEQSYELLDPLGISGAPYAVFDRSILACSRDSKAPAIIISFPNPNEGADYLRPYLEKCIETPTFVSVGITNQYDSSTRKLVTTVSGERNDLFELCYKEAYLTVQLKETAVETKGAQNGSGEKIHNHVFRHSLTPMFGNRIVWDGYRYSVTYEYTIPDTWNDKNVSVVAIVNRPYSRDSEQLQVINVEELNLYDSHTQGIGDALADEARVLSRSYYNLQGKRITSLSEVKGVYIEKIVTNKGVVVSKKVR